MRVVLIGFPASDPASAGRRCHRYAVGQKRGRSNFMSTHQFNDMENQPSFAERTKQLKEIAFQLKNAADVVLAEVQHMEAAAVRFKGRVDKKKNAPRTKRTLTIEPAWGYSRGFLTNPQSYHSSRPMTVSAST